MMNHWAGQPLPISATAWHDGDCWRAPVRRAQRRSTRPRRQARRRGGRRRRGAALLAATCASRPTAVLRAAAGRCGASRCSRPTPPLDAAGAQLIEWGGALRWLRVRCRRADACARLRHAAGGHATLFRGGDKRAGVFHAACRRRWLHTAPQSEASVRPGGHLQSRPAVSGILTSRARSDMETNLADFIKDTPEGSEAEAILRNCVHCGFCTATCPTYQLLGDELDGPRGRIYLIKQVLEGARGHRKDAAASRPLPDLPRLRNHLPVRRAVRPAARHRPRSGRRPGGRGAVRNACSAGALRTVMPRAALFGSAARSSASSCAPLLPAALKRKVPAAARRATRGRSARHARRMLVLDGCVQPAPLARHQRRRRARARPARHLADRAPKAGCCGAVAFHLERAGTKRSTHMRRNIDAWWPHVEAGRGSDRHDRQRLRRRWSRTTATCCARPGLCGESRARLRS